jgi:hypothetical protein
MKTRHYTLRDVARVLKVKPYQVTYALSVGHVPEPGTRINNKRVFQQDDIDRLATHFGVGLGKDGRRQDGRVSGDDGH